MKFISEEKIDEAALLIGAVDNYEEFLVSLSESQPALVNYLYSESFESFTLKEQQLFLFVTLVVWKAIEQANNDIPEISEDDIANAEEKNWNLLDSIQKGGDFRDRLTPFFDEYGQEDLLAFVEDSVTPDEDNVVTEEGKEYLFISLKTIIDSFHQAIGE